MPSELQTHVEAESVSVTMSAASKAIIIVRLERGNGALWAWGGALLAHNGNTGRRNDLLAACLGLAHGLCRLCTSTARGAERCHIEKLQNGRRGWRFVQGSQWHTCGVDSATPVIERVRDAPVVILPQHLRLAKWCHHLLTR